ncbi:hypothetical protein N7499_001822 [Penicillium canescens]|nr:hypothetical protein N7499_001822 [Penicillium canescens]
MAWCMHCFRTFLDNWDTSGPPVIPCWDDGLSSKRCRQCASRNKNCEPVNEGILGDAIRLQCILDWVKPFWDKDEEKEIFHLEDAAFGELDVAKAYEAVVHNRRGLLHPIPITPGMSSLRRLVAEASTYPGARLSDDGYYAWAFAVQTFRSRVYDIVVDQEQYDNLTNPDIEQLEADAAKDFPVEDYLV